MGIKNLGNPIILPAVFMDRRATTWVVLNRDEAVFAVGFSAVFFDGYFSFMPELVRIQREGSRIPGRTDSISLMFELKKKLAEFLIEVDFEE
jgi:hypothetical protein